MFTKQFLIDMSERAIKTFAQTIVASVSVVGSTTGFELLEVNWLPIILVALIAAGISVMTSIASSFKGDPKSASLVK
jgi:hypothetical protein